MVWVLIGLSLLHGIEMHCFEDLHYFPLSNAEVGGKCLEKARCTNSFFQKQGYVNAVMDPPSAPNMTHFLPWIIYTVVGQVMLPAGAAVERATARIYPHVLKFVRIQQFVLLLI